MDALQVIEAVYDARRRRDTAAVLALCSDAMVYSCNADPDKPGDGMTLVGKAGNRSNLELIDEVWEPVDSTVGPLHVQQEPIGPCDPAALPPATRVRAVVKFSIRHRASSQVLEGTKTHEWTIRNGKIVALCETFDREMLHAFLRMSEWSLEKSAEADKKRAAAET